uniref:Amiloride-sensitive sodium channel n=1 Tax=Plectus sambesii TaxID=2011161 RepID=A0A914W1J2_9BILA
MAPDTTAAKKTVIREQRDRRSSYLDQFCDFTAMEGFRFLHSRNPKTFRSIAIVLLLMCVSLFSYQTVDRLSNFVRKPVLINSEQMLQKKIKFPNLLLCFESQYQVITADSVPPEVGRLLRRITTESQQIPEVDELASIYHRLKIKTTTLARAIRQANSLNRTNEAVLSDLEKLGKELIDILPQTGRLLMTRDIEPFLVLNGRDFSSGVDFSLFKNSQQLWDSCLDLQALDRTSRVGRAEPPAMVMNLTLETALCRARKAEEAISRILHLDLSKYFLSLERSEKGSILKCAWLNSTCKVDKVWTSRGSCFQISAPSKAVAFSRVVGQSSSIRVLIDTNAFEGDPVVHLFFRPSTMKEFALASGDFQLQAGNREKFAINQVVKVYRHESRCGRIPVAGFSEYTQGACQWEHKQRMIESYCNCSWFFGSTEPSVRSRREMEAGCNVTEHHGCANTIDIADNDCPLDCEDEEYMVDRAVSPLSTSSYMSDLPSDWSLRKAEKLDKFVRQARRTGLTSSILLESIDEFFEFHTEMIRLFFTKEEEDHMRNIRYINARIPLRFLLDDGNEDNKFGLQRLSSYLEEQPSPPCLIEQQDNETECLQQFMSTWLKPIKTYQSWLRSELLLPENCIYGHACPTANYVDEVNMASSVVTNSTSSNIADIARFYAISRNLNRMQQMIQQVFVQLNDILASVDEAEMRLNSTQNTTLHLNQSGLPSANQPATWQCLKFKKMMIIHLLNSTVLTPSGFDENKSVWFLEFADLIRLDETKAFLPGRNYDKANLVEVVVFFRSLAVHTITQTSSYTVWMLLSEIGGTMGMYLGATIITVFELILFLCNFQSKSVKFEDRQGMKLRRRKSVIVLRQRDAKL